MREELIREIFGGSRESLAELLALDQEPLYNFMLRRLGHREDAADATQESFRRVLVSLGSLRHPKAYRGWLYRIALNVAREMERERRARHRLAHQEAILDSQRGGASMDKADRTDLSDRLRTALQGLDEHLQTAVLLRYEQGLSYEEIAEATRTRVGTVAKRLHDAHGRLHKALAAAGASLAVGALGEALAAAPRHPLPPDLAEAIRHAALHAGPVAPRAPLRHFMPLVAVSALGGLFGLVILVHSFRSLAANTTERQARRALAGTDVAQGLPLSKASGDKPSPRSATALSLAVLRGAIRDQETHQPIPGASVWLQESKTTPPLRFSGVTKPDGSFVIEAPPGEYAIDALAEGYVRYQSEIHIRVTRFEVMDPGTGSGVRGPLELKLEGGSAQTFDFELLRSQELRGLVVDSRGDPISGARIQLHTQEFEWRSPKGNGKCQFAITYEPDGESLDFRTDSRGAFLIDHLYPDGPCRIEVSHPGFASLNELLAPRAPRRDLRLTLQKGLRLSGRVTGPRGEPVRNASLLLDHPPESGFQSAPYSAAEPGTFVLADLPPETSHLFALAPGYGPAHIDLEGKDAESLMLVLPVADQMATGVVLDELGQPLPGVAVRVNHYDLVSGGIQARLVLRDEKGSGSASGGDGWRIGFLPAGHLPAQGTSQSDGRFDLSGLCVSTNLSVGLVFTKEGYEPATCSVSDTRVLQIQMKPRIGK